MKEKTPQELLRQWVADGQFEHKGLTYKKFVNEISAETLLNDLMKGQSITVPIAGYQDYTGNRDLDSNYHKGFTIAPKGRTLYWMMIWHGSGHVTVVNKEATYRRWIDGDSIITIYWL